MIKKAAFYFFIILLITICLALGYFILVNTVFADRVLPNVKVAKVDASFLDSETAENFVLEEVLNIIPDHLEVIMDGFYFDVPTSELVIDISAREEIINYGKGTDFFSVLSQGLKLLDGEDIELGIVIDTIPLLEAYPFILNSNNPAILQGNEAHNCENREYNLDIDHYKLTQLINDSIRNSEVLDISLSDIVHDPESAKIIELCNSYYNEINSLKASLEEIFGDYLDDVIAIYWNGVEPAWEISDEYKLRELLMKYKIKYDKPVDQGRYEILNGKIALFENYEGGRNLNINATIDELEDWILDPSTKFQPIATSYQPSILASGLEIMNFTSLVASGRTRIDKIRSGVENWVVRFAQAGVEEVHNQVIQPGEEFSFLKVMNPQPGGWTDDGRPIGNGTCNAATTLFRAALEAGFPITDRSYHAHYFSSYDWPYSDLVDATYLSNPPIDLKFINDLDYPVILRSEVYLAEDGWQYHTINVYSDPATANRSVELGNWTRWNVQSERVYESSFTREVRDDGEVVRSDEFYSRYI